MSYFGSMINDVSTMLADQMIRQGDFALTSPKIVSEEIGGSNSSDAAVVTLSGNCFRIKLAKHLNDYKHGEGNLSEEMYGQLEKKNIGNNAFLTSYNPEAAHLYSGYLTAGFSYDSKARFVAGIDGITKSVAMLNKTTI